MPRGAVRDQGVPPAGAPPLGDAVSLHDEVRHAVAAQMLAHRHAGLPRADDEHLYRFVWQPVLRSRRSERSYLTTGTG